MQRWRSLLSVVITRLGQLVSFTEGPGVCVHGRVRLSVNKHSLFTGIQ